jgi:hypothetical protein
MLPEERVIIRASNKIAKCESNDWFQSRFTETEKKNMEYYENCYFDERQCVTIWLNFNEVEDVFVDLQINGKISLAEAHKLAMVSLPGVHRDSLRHYFECYGGDKTAGISCEAFEKAIGDAARVACFSEVLKEELAKIKKEQSRLSAYVVLAKLRDFAPQCTEEQLVEFVLEKCDFCWRKISLKEYAEIMCPLKR